MIHLLATLGQVAVVLLTISIIHALPPQALKTGTKQPAQEHSVQLPQSLHRVQVLAEHMGLT